MTVQLSLCIHVHVGMYVHRLVVMSTVFPVHIELWERAVGGTARTVHWKRWRSYPSIDAAMAAARRNRLTEQGKRWRIVVRGNGPEY